MCGRPTVSRTTDDRGGSNIRICQGHYDFFSILRCEARGRNVLGRAAASGDETVMRLLIGRGAEKGRLPGDLGTRAEGARAAPIYCGGWPRRMI